MGPPEGAVEDHCGAGERSISVGEASGGQVHDAEIAERQSNLEVIRAEHRLERRQHLAQRFPRLPVTAPRLENRRERGSIGGRFEVVRRHALDGRSTR
jgi:hypothetical protein